MFTIVAVYNNKEALNKYLVSSLKKQNVNYELILLDNCHNQYSCAAQALNDGYKKSKADNKYMMFVHQDIEFPFGDWLEKAEEILDQIFDFGIAGIAGMTPEGEKNSQRGRGEVLHGVPLKKWNWGNKVDQLVQVQTLDESLVIIPRKIFNKLQFDELTCDKWHLYAVDYSLAVQEKFNLLAYVLPLPINHFSVGSVDSEYFKTLKKVLIKHKKKYSRIYTTCGDFTSSYPLFLQKMWDKISIE